MAHKRFAWSLAACLLLVAVLFTGAIGPAFAAKQEIEVYAAASLTESFTTLKQIFEKRFRDVEVMTSFNATSTLRFQVEQGAKPEVFGSANLKHIQALEKGSFLERGFSPMAHNSVVIITPKTNKARVRKIADLTKRGVALAACAPQVPIGNYTVQVLDKLDKSGKYGKNFKRNVQANLVSLEPTVKGIVAKVVLGEVDAGLVYASDVTSGIKKKVNIVTIPEEYNVNATCYIAVAKGCKRPDLGRKFVELVLSTEGQKILQRNGLLPIKPSPDKQCAEGSR